MNSTSVSDIIVHNLFTETYCPFSGNIFLPCLIQLNNYHFFKIYFYYLLFIRKRQLESLLFSSN